MKHPLLLCSAAIMFLAGVFALVKAKQIQTWVGKWDNWPFQEDIESPGYVVFTRIWGVLVITVSIFFAYAAYASR